MASQAADPGRALVDGLATLFVESIGTLIGRPGKAIKRAAAVDAAWLVRIQSTGHLRGSVMIGLSGGDAIGIAKLVMGMDQDPPDAAVRDTLEELSSQACGAVTETPAGQGCQFTIEAVGAAEAVPADEPLIFEASFDEALTAHLALWSALAAVERPAAAVAGPAKSAPGDNLDVILDIDLPMVVRFGESELPLQALVELGPGSVIDLGRSPDEPVDVLVSGKMVARGEVVVVGGNYGVRITEVISRVERIRQIGA